MKRRLSAGLAGGCLLLTCVAGLVATPASAAPVHHVVSDFDGDGRPDLAIGAPDGDQVLVHYTHARPGGHAAQELDGTGRFGTTLAVGDFDGDGFSDLAVGAPNVFCGASPGEECGAFTVYDGSRHGLRHPVFYPGPYDGDEPYSLGTALAVGDVNGDGYDDLVASIPEADFGVRIYDGGPDGLHADQFTSLDGQGATAVVLADVNGDGHPDLITGTSFADGILIFRGTAHGIHAGSPQSITAHQVGVFQLLGETLAAADVNGDGYPDVLAGAPRDTFFPHHPSSGSVVLLTGGPHGLSAAHHQTVSERGINAHWRPESGFGDAITTVTVPGRRYRDIVVGAPDDRVSGRKGAGAVYVFRCDADGLRRRHVQRITLATEGVPGPAGAGAHFGAAVFGTRLGHAGKPSVLVGAPGSDFAVHNAGQVDIFRAATTGLTPNGQTFTGTSANEGLGASIR